MTVLLISNSGAGYANNVEISANMSVSDLFKREMGEKAKEIDFILRVNRLPCSKDQVLQDGDRVSITPVKIQGAAA